MKKTKFIKIFVLLVLLISVVGCNKNDVTKYFKKTKGDESLVEGLYDEDDSGQFYVYVFNNSPDKFVKFDLKIEEENSKNVLFEEKEIFLSPDNFFIDFLDSMPGLYYTPNLTFYTIEGPADFEYDYNYGYGANDEYITNIAKVGGFTEDELEKAAKQEYIIAVATEMFETEYYYYDQEYDIEEGFSQFDPSTAIYKATVDYDTKEIILYSLKDGSAKELKTIEMPFGINK